MTDRTTSDTIQGPVAQKVEQRPCKSQAAGSIPGQGLHRLPNGQEFIDWEYYADLGRRAQVEYIELIQSQTRLTRPRLTNDKGRVDRRVRG